MSLLDDLKQQAEALQKNHGPSSGEALREALYEERLRPKMHAIFRYLGELTEQLKLVDPDVRHDFRLPGIGDVKGLRQAGYVVNADSTEQTRQIRLRFHCLADSEKEYAVKPKSAANETRDFLESQNMRYAEWPIRDNTAQMVGINFQLQVKVNINIIFQADLAQGAIKMITSNFAAFGAERSVIQPERITEHWLDNLGNYILRRHQDIHQLEIDESVKASIRRRLETDKRARENELKRAGLPVKKTPGEKTGKTFLGKMIKLGKK